MELLNEVEEAFDIRVNDDTVTSETTVGEFIAFVEAKVAGTAT
jgi:acyl carrier protein